MAVLTRMFSPARIRTRLMLCVLLVVLVSGCDALLDVKVPGAVASTALDDPRLMPSLVIAARGELECALGTYITGQALIANEMITSTSWRPINIWGGHLEELRTQTGPCPETTSSTTTGFYVSLSSARFQADDAFKRIDAFSANEVPTKTQAQAMLAGMAGYAYTMLGEGFCEMAIDGGPLMTPAQVFEKALERFAKAGELAQQANDAALRNLSLVGRARVLINLGRKAEAAAAAKGVPPGFVFNATYSTANPRRQNRVYLTVQNNKFLTFPPEYRNLTVGGTADRRVPVTGPSGLGHDAKTPFFTQAKYGTANSPIPIATWREAQLIIAEAELGQSAVDRINALRDAAGLPRYSPANVNDNQAVLGQVIEERRRELFLEGHRLGDMLRFKIPFAQGLNHIGEPYGPITCLPLPDGEYDGNPNITRR
ncbi:MAG: RagB/SusD family nutrient uptake outer membrane protein [Longimicrobiales bacterium]|nr:RagB/SusD family nutrient uptake outer membrane protein [Longimicrobiales bacterium]